MQRKLTLLYRKSRPVTRPDEQLPQRVGSDFDTLAGHASLRQHLTPYQQHHAGTIAESAPRLWMHVLSTSFINAIMSSMSIQP
jgi:hypothetical protein